jgi:TonB family protein
LSSFFRKKIVNQTLLLLTAAGCILAAEAGSLKSLMSAANGKTDSHVHEKFALLISVDHFQDSSVPPNPAALTNIAMLQNVLISPAGKFAEKHVHTLTGADATADGIYDAVENWLDKKALPDDLLFVYICSRLATGRNDHPIFYAFDTSAHRQDASGIDLVSFLSEIKQRTQAKYLICALDTSPAPNSNGADLLALPTTGAAIFSATNGHQISLNNGVTGSSVFVHHLCESVNLEAGTITLDNAFDQVSRLIKDDATRAFSTTQSPLFAAPANFPISIVALGMPARGQPAPAPFVAGHPLDRLALDHPELIPPNPQTRSAIDIAALQQEAAAGKAAQQSLTTTAATKSPSDQAPAEAPKPRPNYSSYMRVMRAVIQNHWSPPKTLVDKRIVANFQIYKDGHIESPEIVESCGDQDIDRSALQAIKASSPLPPLPDGSPEWVEMRFKFNWQVKSKQL